MNFKGFKFDCGKIKEVFYGVENCGSLTCMLFIEWDDGGTQGFGGYVLDYFNTKTNQREIHPYGVKIMDKLKNDLKINRLEDLINKNIIAIKNHKKILAISLDSEINFFSFDDEVNTKNILNDFLKCSPPIPLKIQGLIETSKMTNVLEKILLKTTLSHGIKI